MGLSFLLTVNIIGLSSINREGVLILKFLLSFSETKQYLNSCAPAIYNIN